MGASSSSAVPTIVASFFGISGVLSLFASLFTLYLVYHVAKKGGHRQLKSNTFLTIVACIAIGQAVYDFSLLLYGIVITALGESNVSHSFFPVVDLLEAFSFISTSLWTNVLNAILFYVVVTSRSVDVSKHYRMYCLIVYVPSFLVALPYMLPSAYESHLAEQVDYSFRIFSIAVNVLVYIFISCRVHSMKLHTSEHLAGKAIYVLVRKLKYYSVVLIVSRFFATWYEFEFDLTASYNAEHSLDSPRQNFVFCMSAALTPTAGLGYLGVFLIFNETARSHSYHLFLTYFCCRTTSSPLTDKLLDNDNNNNMTDQEGEAMDEASSSAYGYGVARSASQLEAGGGNVEEEGEEGCEGDEEQQSISSRTSNSSRLSSSSISLSASRTKSKTLSKSRSDSSVHFLELLDEEQLFREIDARVAATARP